ncbi:hypothetical protein SAMN02745823_02440 [Sporobacter termitidis DSM 10068]|uniref:Double-GTPase 2 domain-containing protein n=1 Tax=Sporobacter termitidis DSM 10068 TaxID=1123282 RepID=A0A1M5YEQ0_9FIRM|nr:hypothetical protein [Sporobacter termitidis]SHI10379.1 hypothetical protein SAMN02745823_02440 [Sporobacter termitidis DSM 10068]
MADNIITTTKLPELEAERLADVDNLISDDIEMSDSENLREDSIRKGYQRLPSGRALSLHETYSVMAAENTVLIILIGPSECGKTTIETTLYQLFQRNSVSEFLFAGSKTIQGYEERAFYTRVNSKQEVATTPRTSRGLQEIFLHLCLFDRNKKQRINYLFADLSGEEIQAHLANVNSLTQNMSFIRHANSFTVILDGERLANKHQRNGVIEEASTILRTILDAGLYSSSTKVQLVISKYDIIEASNDANTKQYIEKNLQELQLLITKYINKISVHKVAAMPNKGSLEVGFGLDNLLTSWEYIPSYLQMNITYGVKYSLKSEFNKLFYKLAGEAHE